MKTKKEFCHQTIRLAIQYRPVRRIIYRASWHQVKFQPHIACFWVVLISPHPPFDILKLIKLMFAHRWKGLGKKIRKILISLVFSFFSFFFWFVRRKQCRVTRIPAMPEGVYLRLAQTVQILVMTTTVSKVRVSHVAILSYLYILSSSSSSSTHRRHHDGSWNWNKKKCLFVLLNPIGVTTLNANCSRFFICFESRREHNAKEKNGNKKNDENTIKAKALAGILNQTYRCRFHFFSLIFSSKIYINTRWCIVET